MKTFLCIVQKVGRNHGSARVCDLNHRYLLSFLLRQRLGYPCFQPLHLMQVNLQSLGWPFPRFSLCSPLPFCLHFSIWRFILSCCLLWLCFHLGRNRFSWQPPRSPLGLLLLHPWWGADLPQGHPGSRVGICWEWGADPGSWSAWPRLLFPLPQKLGPSWALFFFFFCFVLFPFCSSDWVTFTPLVTHITSLFSCLLWPPAGFHACIFGFSKWIQKFYVFLFYSF